MIEEIRQILSDNGLEFAESKSRDGDLVLETWHEKRKITFYIDGESDQVIRVWGPSIITEMSIYNISHPLDSQSHIDWLLGR